MSEDEQPDPSARVRVRHREVLSDAWARVERVRFDYRHSATGWQSQTREIYHRGHGAAVLLYNRQRQTVVLVRQFRFPVFDEESARHGRSEPSERGFLLEVPAGILEHENPAATVMAEVEEETGFQIDSPRFLFAAYVSPGSVTERLHYYEAEYDPSRRTGAGGGRADEGEDIEVMELQIADALAAVRGGEIRDGKTIILLQHAVLTHFPAVGRSYASSLP